MRGMDSYSRAAVERAIAKDFKPKFPPKKEKN
jgi:hypothetical protein